MIVLALRGIAERKLRSALTAIAVLLGVAMIAGTYVQTDQIKTAFEDIEQTAYSGTDAVIVPRTEFTSSFGAVEPISQSVVRRVQGVPGVAKAEGSLFDSGQIVKDGKAVEATFAPAIAMSVSGEPFNPFDVVQGRLPAGPGEIAVNRKLADDEGLQPGRRLGLTTRSGIKPVRLVGVVDYGEVSSIGGATLVLATLPDMQAWYDRKGQVTEIAVAAAEGTTPEQLARRLDAVLPPSLEVKTGGQQAQETADEINDAIGGFLTPALLALAGASLLVGAFIIFNTFSITVAQRTRELGMLRAIGATRRQVLGTIGAEALLIGATASIAGLLAGLGISKLLGGLFDAAGMGIPRGDMELAPRTIAIGLAVGIGVTLLSALAPALRATRVSPVAAMVEAPPPAGRSRRRTVVSV
ncbi:MAG: ABC transporter permease, partial [Solirubrobacterales bacterium]|nr:ABC transporter permease [Solirubrobacterales bacterium]